MRKTYLIALILLLISCTQIDPPIAQIPPTTTQIPATSTPLPTAVPPTPTNTPSPEPTVTNTTLPPTATATPTPTMTPEPEHVLPASGFDFENAGKILGLGANGAWDDFAMWTPDVLFHDGTYHMFYVGFSNDQYVGSGIGYATSDDGIRWAKHENNPILTGADPFRKIQSPAVFVEDGQWVMYLDGADNGEIASPNVLRATASNPSGPWTLDPTPLQPDILSRTWNRTNEPATILHTGDEYRLYYGGVGTQGVAIGFFTSPDGTTWAHHDDPATTERAFSQSDPILFKGGDEWEMGSVSTWEVMLNDGVWEMFYVGFPVNPYEQAGVGSLAYDEPLKIGYATSEDGVTWVKYAGNPVIDSEEICWPLIESQKIGDEYIIYYDIDCGAGGIGIFRGTIDIE